MFNLRSLLEDAVQGFNQQQGRAQPRSQQEIRQAPFKMYEDQSYQGDPRGFQNPQLRFEDESSMPRYKFYEDNRFTDNAPRFKRQEPESLASRFRELLNF